MKRWLLVFGWCCYYLAAGGQNLLSNPSFEQHPHRSGWMPRDWINAGPITETPPDVHTNQQPHFGVRHHAAHGEAYLGMVARDNFTFESIAQRIPGKLQAGTTYELRLWVSYSPDLASVSRLTQRPVVYDQPIPFDVYLSDKANGDPFELVVRSEPVTHTDWQEYAVRFTPTKAYKYLRIGAGMNTLYARPVCGNVLIDDLSLTTISTTEQ